MKSTARSTQGAASVFVIFCELRGWIRKKNLSVGVLGNSDNCPGGGGESHGPDKLPRADGNSLFGLISHF